jgi:hypothetical protein
MDHSLVFGILAVVAAVLIAVLLVFWGTVFGLVVRIQ